MYLISFVSLTTVVRLVDYKADLQRPKARLTVTRAIRDLGASRVRWEAFPHPVTMPLTPE